MRINEEMKNRIRGEIARNRMNQKQFAETIGYHEKYLSALLNGRLEVSEQFVDMIAGALHTRPEYLKAADSFRTREEYIKNTVKGSEELKKAASVILASAGIESQFNGDEMIIFEAGKERRLAPESALTLLSGMTDIVKAYTLSCLNVNIDA